MQKVNVKIYRKHKKRITGKRGEGIRSLQSHFKIKTKLWIHRLNGRQKINKETKTHHRNLSECFIYLLGLKNKEICLLNNDMLNFFSICCLGARDELTQHKYDKVSSLFLAVFHLDNLPKKCLAFMIDIQVHSSTQSWQLNGPLEIASHKNRNYHIIENSKSNTMRSFIKHIIIKKD